MSKPYTVDDVIRDLRRGLLIGVVALMIGVVIWLARAWGLA